MCCEGYLEWFIFHKLVYSLVNKKTFNYKKSPLVLIVLFIWTFSSLWFFAVSDLYRTVTTEQSIVVSRLVNKVVNIVIESIKFKMLNPPMGKVSLPCYEGFTNFLVWPKPNAVSIESNEKTFLHFLKCRLRVIMVLWQRSQSLLQLILVTMWCCHTTLVACMLHMKMANQ